MLCISIGCFILVVVSTLLVINAIKKRSVYSRGVDVDVLEYSTGSTACDQINSCMSDLIGYSTMPNALGRSACMLAAVTLYNDISAQISDEEILYENEYLYTLLTSYKQAIISKDIERQEMINAEYWLVLESLTVKILYWCNY